MVLPDGVSSENADSYKTKLFNLSIGMRIHTFLHKAMEFPSSLKAFFGKEFVEYSPKAVGSNCHPKEMLTSVTFQTFGFLHITK